MDETSSPLNVCNVLQIEVINVKLVYFGDVAMWSHMQGQKQKRCLTAHLHIKNEL